MSTLHGLVFMIFIAGTLGSADHENPSVYLDISCANSTQCGGPTAICQAGICQCQTPFYTPCGASECKISEKFVYEGGECRVDGNCLDNADCNKTEKRCQCRKDYTPMDGLCYKSLNTNCTNSSECWSGECRNTMCQCPWGFISRNDNNRCERKSANIYENWTNANASNDFCYPTDPFSCHVASAVCRNDSQHSEHFCQCPFTHTADYAKQECQLKEYSGLSPSNTLLSTDGCGICKMENALCAFVGNQTTCWCQAGYIKHEDQCVKHRQPFIFPNRNDMNLHNYTSNCSMYANNGLCTCAPGHRFVNQTSTCQPLKPKWIDGHIEYGVCTQINSNGKPIQNNGSCPTLLKCEARRDKDVCSCGRDAYLDETTNACYYFLGRNLTALNATLCPKNSIFNETSGKCQCEATGVFSVSSDHKRCELRLNNETNDSQTKPPCDPSSTPGDQFCASLYGENAKFCRTGECRCMLNNSYYANNTCVTLISAPASVNPICPVNAENNNGVCECKIGYRVENGNNRTCGRKVNRLNEKMAPTESTPWNLAIDDCRALFPCQPVNVSNETCTCDQSAFFNGTICVFYLGYPDPSANSSVIQCPKNANASSGSCKCSSGYRQTNESTCDPWARKVYQNNAAMGENLTTITSEDCRALFGSAADVSENETFCRCRNETVAFWNANQCYFLLETDLGEIDPGSACPPNSAKANNRCACLAGYRTNSSRTICEQKPIVSFNLQAINIDTLETKCNASYTDEDCEVFHGIGAVCRANQCYCDRSRSYVQNNRCVLYSHYIFPGVHEYHLYTCDTDDDCGEKNGTECQFGNENYRVCQCKKDYFFNPIDSTCIQNECYPKCSTNEECRNDRCVCSNGYYRDASKQCVKYDRAWKLHERCNQTYGYMETEDLECSSGCERVQCSVGYRDDGSTCVKYRFNDRCVHDQNLCSNISPGSQCNQLENRCACLPDYYQTNGSRICARGVGLSCTIPIDCGDFGDCLNRACICQVGRKEMEGIDSSGRKINTCVNGIDLIRINSMLFFFTLIIRIFYT